MEASLTVEQIWVLIALISVGVMAVILLLWTRGGSVGLGREKQVGIYIPEKFRKAHPEMGSALQCLVDELPVIRKARRIAYWKELKAAGVPTENLTAHEDYAFYDQCLGNIIYSGNGIKSFKTMLELEIVSKRFEHKRRDAEYEAYIDELADRLQVESDSYLDRSYRSRVVTDEGGERFRRVSRERLSEIERSGKEELKTVLRRLFNAIMEQGCHFGD